MNCSSLSTTEILYDLSGSSESRTFWWATQITDVWGSKSSDTSILRAGLTGEVDTILTFH